MKIAFLYSGGVDSSLALSLLKERGYDLTVFYLKVWLEDEWADFLGCPWQEDMKYVEKTCNSLDIAYHVLPFQQEYKKRIISYLLNEVKEGRTPNPDLLCNHHIKFGAFWEELERRAPEHGKYDKIATGHYAGLRQVKQKETSAQESLVYELHKGRDVLKDQSYFLAALSQIQLSRALFPLEKFTKAEVRQEALKRKLPAAQRKDSQGLCFLGKISFSGFLERHLGKSPGKIREHESNALLGEHPGFWFYTIGQRQGLALSGGPWYVVAKDIQRNCIYVSRNYYSEEKERNTFYAKDPHWISGHPPQKKELRVKLRHGVGDYPCILEFHSSNLLFVRITANDQGIAPGQFAVFYEGEVCLGCAPLIASPPNQNRYTFSWPAGAHCSVPKSGVSRQV